VKLAPDLATPVLFRVHATCTRRFVKQIVPPDSAPEKKNDTFLRQSAQLIQVAVDKLGRPGIAAAPRK
jgi:hypothetical protein